LQDAPWFNCIFVKKFEELFNYDLMIRKFILLLFLCLFSMKNFATHIVGGEIFYDCLGGNNYRITLKVYRDCYNGIPPLDNPAYVFIFDAAGTFIDSLAMPLPGTTVVPPVINNPCFTPPTDVCVEEGIYQRVINLPPLPGGYNLTYQRCCRNNTILNLINPGDVGSTYMAHIPDPALAICNSSPRFNNFPPIFLCSGVPLDFDHAATDPDGDSLYYEFCDPFTGLDPCCCRLGAGASFCSGGCSSPCPEVGSPPPFTLVPWAPGYNASYPMSSSPAMAVNPSTGLMTGTPNMIGQWVVGVCVSEYRNGILLDVNKRDFQFNVTNCPGLPVASIPIQTKFCFGYESNFTQNSINATTYNWDFGDPTTTDDVSTISSPTWTYPDTGIYTVTLIINQGTLCEDSNSTTFHIQPLLNPEFVPDSSQCDYNNHLNFFALGHYEGTGTFMWNFGTHASPPSANTQNVSDVVFDTAGAFPVMLTITENGCTITDTQTVVIHQKPIANYIMVNDVACVLQPVYFADSSNSDSPLTILWDFGDGTIVSDTNTNPYHVYDTVGSYYTSIIVSTSYGCIDTFSLPTALEVFPTPTAGFRLAPLDTSIFYPDVTIFDESTGASECSVNWGDGTLQLDCNTIHPYSKPGTYQVMQVVKNTSGCYDTAYSEVIIRPEFVFWIPNAFTPNGNGINDVFKPTLMGVHEYRFLIFNRWGENIYETRNSDAGWDGTYKGHSCTDDVYVYKIMFRDDVRNDYHQYIGRVTLVR
jgi:gliding motility-associated-like protein